MSSRAAIDPEPRAYAYGARGHQQLPPSPAAARDAAGGADAFPGGNTDRLYVPVSTMLEGACPRTRETENPYSAGSAYDVRRGVDYISQQRDVNSFSLARHLQGG